MRAAAGIVAAIAVLLAACGSTPEQRAQAAPVPDAVRPPGFVFQGALSQGGLAMGLAPEGTAGLALDGEPIDLAPDGRFLIGFGRDAAESAVIEARFADGGVLRETLRIARRKWSIQSLPTLPRGTSPTPEFLRRRAEELARIKAARAIRSDSQGWRQPFLWPVTGTISGVFGSQRIYAGEPGAPHSGVDIVRPTGTPVVAPADGVVILAAASPFTLEGNLLMIDHGMGLNSAMLHLSRIDVVEGQAVRRGQLIGAIGATGRATGPHLHWGMMWRRQRIDPQLLAGPMPAAAGTTMAR